jgi:hypothetical protein
MTTERRSHSVESDDRLSFETLLLELTARFVNLPSEHVEAEISTALRLVCQSLGLDRSTLWEFAAGAKGARLMQHYRFARQVRDRRDLAAARRGRQQRARAASDRGNLEHARRQPVYGAVELAGG